MKSFNQGLMALLLIAMPVMSADKRQVVTLNMPKHSTVADVICSEQNGHIGFNMPLAPQFTHRGLFRSFPKGMSEYPAFYQTEAGRLTTASMVRFIEQSPSLFTNKEEQATYKQVLAAAVAAHKAWFANKSEANLVALRFAEDKVFNQLKRLSVNTPETGKRLEAILSTPTYNIASRFYRSAVLPGRTWVEENKKANDKTNEIVIKKANPFKIIAKQLMVSVGAPAAYTLIGVQIIKIIIINLFFLKKIKPTPNEVLNFYEKAASNELLRKQMAIPHSVAIWPSVIHAATTILASSYNAFTDFKLTPEPGNGINVKIIATNN